MLPKTDKLSFQPDMMKEFAKTVTKFAGDPLNKFNSPNAMNAKELQENKVLLLGEVSNQASYRYTIVGQ
jgi:capsule polysaccharide export protein KpsC/LpsZ